jgi:hypothetical protein
VSRDLRVEHTVYGSHFVPRRRRTVLSILKIRSVLSKLEGE